VLLCTSGGLELVHFSPSEFFQFAIPAAIYCVNNNLVFAILLHVDSTTFQLLSQLKTVFTGLLFRVFLARELSAVQWLAIVQLAGGTATSQIPRCAGAAGADGGSSYAGLALSIISCVLSAFGGVYSEKLLKDKPKESIHWQNIQLYGWGVALNLGGALLHGRGIGGSALDSVAAGRGGGFAAGFNGWAWAVVVNNALNGLAISAILKYADNIARVYAHACAMLVTMVLSIFLFGQTPTPQLLIAIGLVGASAVQYNLKPEDAWPAPAPSAYALVRHSAHDALEVDE
jgi:UDP-galactose transporter